MLSRSAAAIYRTTYPRPLGFFKKLIKPSDVAKDFGHFQLIRARPEHIPLLVPTVNDFLINEYTCVGSGMKEAPTEVTMGLLENTTRYPISFFGVNRADEIIGFDMQDIVYRDPSADPIPRQQLTTSCPHFSSVLPIIGYGEQRLFELLGVDRYVHNMIGYVPSSLRRGPYARLLSLGTIALSVEEQPQMGFKYSVGIVTSTPSLKTMEKVSYTLHERVPKEMYVMKSGEELKVFDDDEPAMLISLDMEMARDKKIFAKAMKGPF